MVTWIICDQKNNVRTRFIFLSIEPGDPHRRIQLKHGSATFQNKWEISNGFQRLICTSSLPEVPRSDSHLFLSRSVYIAWTCQHSRIARQQGGTNEWNRMQELHVVKTNIRTTLLLYSWSLRVSEPISGLDIRLTVVADLGDIHSMTQKRGSVMLQVSCITLLVFSCPFRFCFLIKDYKLSWGQTQTRGYVRHEYTQQHNKGTQQTHEKSKRK